MTIEVNKDYLSRFYEPELTAYEFLKVFFAFLKKQKIDKVERNLVNFLYEQKNNKKYNNIFDDIAFRSNGVFHYSDDIEDALFNLQNGGLLGKTNPSFGVLLINFPELIVDEILNSVKPEYKVQIENIANEYSQTRQEICRTSL